MTASRLRKMAAMAGLTVALATQATAQGAQSLSPQQQISIPSTPKRVIVVSLEDRKLALVEDGLVKKIYSVAVGKPTTPSPVGIFNIERRVANPVYHHDGRTVPPGPGNPVGTRWMGLSKHGYGIHGTNEPKSIGKAASHGCIRMATPDLEEFYNLVAVGDMVELVGQRNEETARLFGETANPAAPASVQLAVKAIPAPVEAPVQVSVQDLVAENNGATTKAPAVSASAVPVGSR